MSDANDVTRLDDSGMVFKSLKGFGVLEKEMIKSQIKAIIESTGSGVLCWCWNDNRSEGEIAYVVNFPTYTDKFETLDKNEVRHDYNFAVPITDKELKKYRRKSWVKNLDERGIVNFINAVALIVIIFGFTFQASIVCVVAMSVSALAYIVRLANLIGDHS